MEFKNGATDRNMLDNGLQGKRVDMGSYFLKMEVILKDNFVKIKSMARAYTIGKIKRLIMESGSIIKKMEEVS